MSIVCAHCGEQHDVSEIAFGADAPDPWSRLTDEERAESMLSPDQCVIHTPEETAYFIRACLHIPIRTTSDHLDWGVWCSLSERSFDEIHYAGTNPTASGSVRTSVGCTHVYRTPTRSS